jgi:hypothetical protein
MIGDTRALLAASAIFSAGHIRDGRLPLNDLEWSMVYPIQARWVQYPKISCIYFDSEQRLRREALVWRQLQHPFILPFVGLDADTFRASDHIGIVTPWIERGTLRTFMHSESYQEGVDSYRLVHFLMFIFRRDCTKADIDGRDSRRPCLSACSKGCSRRYQRRKCTRQWRRATIVLTEVRSTS